MERESVKKIEGDVKGTRTSDIFEFGEYVPLLILIVERMEFVFKDYSIRHGLVRMTRKGGMNIPVLNLSKNPLFVGGAGVAGTGTGRSGGATGSAGRLGTESTGKAPLASPSTDSVWEKEGKRGQRKLIPKNIRWGRR